MSVHAAESAMGRGGAQSRSYEQHIQQTLSKVSDLTAFVENEHFDWKTLHLFWRNDTRAQLTVHTIGRLLGRSLGDELHEIRELLEQAGSASLFEFDEALGPKLFGLIKHISPLTGQLEDHRAVVEQLHYSADVRQVVLQHSLTFLTARYPPPRFKDLYEASRWTQAFTNTIQSAEEIIQGTRTLLKQEMAAAGEYLHQISREVEIIEAAAEARLGIVKRLRWVNTLEEAETTIHNHLAMRAEQMEQVTFSILTETKNPNFVEMVAYHTVRKAPKLGMLLLGLVGTGVAAQTATKVDLSNVTLPRLPQPVRGETNAQDTARFTALSSDTQSARSAQYVTAAVQQLVSSVQTQNQVTEQGEQARARVDQFFNGPNNATGRQTVVLNSSTELRALIDQLVPHGYSEQDVLSLLQLSSVDSLTQPVTLEMRQGRQRPLLFPYNASTQVTAPHSAIVQNTAPQAAVVQNTAPQAVVPQETAPQAAIAQHTAAQPVVAQAEAPVASVAQPLTPSDTYIVYRVQPSESLADIATRYGTTISQIVADNKLDQESVSRGQNLLIRRPGGTASGQTSAVGQVQNPNIASGGSIGGGVSSRSVDLSALPEIGAAVADQTSSVSARLYSPAQANDIVARYGDTLFPEVESMPADAQSYLLGTVQEVGEFFDVRPGDIMGIMRLEQNNAGWRLQETRTSSVGATGVGQIVARTWNGWANPEHDNYVSNVLDIEEHGGLGFDWAKREEWRAWREGRGDRSLLQDSNADPNIFENSVASIARHLVHWGLTTDFAERDPEGFAARLADSIAVYNSGRTLDVSADWVQSEGNRKTTGQYVAEAMATSEELAAVIAQPSVAVAPTGATQGYAQNYKQLYDQSFGVLLSEDEIALALSANEVLFEDVRSGKVDSTAAAIQLLDQIEQKYMAEGRSAILNGAPRPWPFVHNRETLYAQKSATSLMGRTLTLYELDDLMNRTKADRDAIRSELMSRADTRLFLQARHLYNQMLSRTDRQLPVYVSEVTQLVQPLMAGYSPVSMTDETLQAISAQLQRAIESSEEFQQLHSDGRFEAMPLSPMPEVFKGFGVAIDYQVGGRHTGIDLANPRTADGKEPPIYAVEDATVVHVGPVYCEVANACRGGKAIILDHGNHVYSIYSHNSEANVLLGERVEAGQMIGRQGNEGYSFGSHLHFEIHTGAPYTGNWQEPFAGGQFVDPMEYLPSR